MADRFVPTGPWDGFSATLKGWPAFRISDVFVQSLKGLDNGEC